MKTMVGKGKYDIFCTIYMTNKVILGLAFMLVLLVPAMSLPALAQTSYTLTGSWFNLCVSTNGYMES